MSSSLSVRNGPPSVRYFATPVAFGWAVAVSVVDNDEDASVFTEDGANDLAGKLNAESGKEGDAPCTTDTQSEKPSASNGAPASEVEGPGLPDDVKRNTYTADREPGLHVHGLRVAETDQRTWTIHVCPECGDVRVSDENGPNLCDAACEGIYWPNGGPSLEPVEVVPKAELDRARLATAVPQQLIDMLEGERGELRERVAALESAARELVTACRLWVPVPGTPGFAGFIEAVEQNLSKEPRDEGH